MYGLKSLELRLWSLKPKAPVAWKQAAGQAFFKK